MNVPDIRQNILLQLPFNDLIRACSTDQLSRQICSNDAFWIRKFERDGVPLMNKRTNLEGWLLEYKYSALCARRTHGIMEILKEPDLARMPDGGLHFNISEPNDLVIISNLGVNLTESVNYLLDTFISKKLNRPSVRYNSDITYDIVEQSYFIRVRNAQKLSDITAYNLIYNIEYHNMQHVILDVPESLMRQPRFSSLGRFVVDPETGIATIYL